MFDRNHDGMSVQMNLNFLDEYWNIVGSEQGTQAIRQNKHFEPLTKLLLETNDSGIPEDKIPVKYRPWKKKYICRELDESIHFYDNLFTQLDLLNTE